MGILINLQPRGFGAQVCWDCEAMRYCSALGQPASFAEEGHALFGPMRDQALRRLAQGGLVLRDQLLCANSWHNNYFHFLLETLPALARGLETIRAEGLHLRGLLLDHRAPYVLTCLERLKYQGPLLETVGAAVPLQAPVVAQPSDLHAMAPAVRRGVLSDVVAFLRSFFAPERQSLPDLVMSTSSKQRRIFIERGRESRSSSNFGSRRRLEPQQRFHRDLVRNDFEIVYLEGMPLAEQIALFASADELVAVHGAALANIAFCRPDCRITEIVIDSYAAGTVFGDLACAAQLKGFRTLLASSALSAAQERDYVQSLAERGIKPSPLRLPLRYDARIREALGL